MSIQDLIRLIGDARKAGIEPARIEMTDEDAEGVLSEFMGTAGPVYPASEPMLTAPPRDFLFVFHGIQVVRGDITRCLP